MTTARNSLVAALDVGGTNLRLALVNRQGDIVARQAGPTPRTVGPQEFVAGLAVAIREMVTGAGLDFAAVAGVGVGVPGRVVPEAGRVLFCPNLPVLTELDLGPALAALVPWPVVIENDANLFALGEHWLGAGARVPTLLGLTLGTGVGGGLILEGRLWPGAEGTSAEIGHMTVEPEGFRCHCGNRGCLETMASASWTVVWIKDRLAAGEASRLRPLWESDPDKLTGRGIFMAAQEGDPLAQAAFARVGGALGLAIANVVHLLGVSHVVIGGKFARAWEEFSGPLRRELAARLTMFPKDKLRIMQASLGDNAGLLGAAHLAWAQGNTG